MHPIVMRLAEAGGKTIYLSFILFNWPVFEHFSDFSENVVIMIYSFL